ELTDANRGLAARFPGTFPMVGTTSTSSDLENNFRGRESVPGQNFSIGIKADGFLRAATFQFDLVGSFVGFDESADANAFAACGEFLDLVLHGLGCAGQLHFFISRKKSSVDVKGEGAVSGVGFVSDLVVVETLMNLALRPGLTADGFL